MLPPYRQMFYQLCDLEVDQIQSIIHRNDGKEEVCDERDGWCMARTADELRDIMSLMIKKTIRESKGHSTAGLFHTPKTKEKSVTGISKRDYDEEEEDDEDEEYQPSDGSENEMETEILDYM
ncbi:general transcription factor 3C polypeptide 5-like isoform X1 [Engraulis encrasicolus]